MDSMETAEQAAEMPAIAEAAEMVVVEEEDLEEGEGGEGSGVEEAGRNGDVDLNALTVKALRSELEARGLSNKGRKSVLATRLGKAISDGVSSPSSPSSPSSAAFAVTTADTAASAATVTKGGAKKKGSKTGGKTGGKVGGNRKRKAEASGDKDGKAGNDDDGGKSSKRGGGGGGGGKATRRSKRKA